MASHKCKSTDELRSAIIKEMARAMTEVHDITKGNAEVNISNYYSIGDPKKYRRTGMLPNAMYTSPLKLYGNVFKFETMLDPNRVDYENNPQSVLSSVEVLSATEFHTNDVLGRSHFFEKTESEIDDTIKNVFYRKGFR